MCTPGYATKSEREQCAVPAFNTGPQCIVLRSPDRFVGQKPMP